MSTFATSVRSVFAVMPSQNRLTPPCTTGMLALNVRLGVHGGLGRSGGGEVNDRDHQVDEHIVIQGIGACCEEVEAKRDVVGHEVVRDGGGARAHGRHRATLLSDTVVEPRDSGPRRELVGRLERVFHALVVQLSGSVGCFEESAFPCSHRRDRDQLAVGVDPVLVSKRECHLDVVRCSSGVCAHGAIRRLGCTRKVRVFLVNRDQSQVDVPEERVVVYPVRGNREKVSPLNVDGCLRCHRVKNPRPCRSLEVGQPEEKIH
eukprot:1327954-Rhodomonas_salina.2